jgi:hypothetical protein
MKGAVCVFDCQASHPQELTCMPIKVTCSCGQKLAVKDALAGKKVKCPKCKQPLAIPGPGSTKSPSPTGAQPASASKRRVSGADEPSGSISDLLDEVGLRAPTTGRRCPHCFADMGLEAIICIQCGYNTETGKRLRTKRDIIDGR